MIFGSVCSGIEAASVAWGHFPGAPSARPLGWRAAFFSEIDAFPRAVLKHHYPDVPLHGDFTTIREGQYAAIDVLVGGTPCQSFSVAGLRAGLDDERGNLALEFCKLARRLRPRWIVWENVPGVLSLDGGRAFASILGGLADCGYGLAYRVLDAQFVRVDGFARAVPQRRRRVFVVGYLGDWRRAAAVLFERESLSGNPPPRREAGQATAATLGTSAARRRGLDDRGDPGANLIAGEPFILAQNGSDIQVSSIPGALTAGHAKQTSGDLVVAFGGNNTSGTIDAAAALNAKGGAGRMDFETETLVAHALRADGFDASEDGTGRGTPLVPICFTSKDYGNDAAENVAPTLRSMNFDKSHANAGGQLAVCFDETQITSATNRCQPQPGDPSHPLAAGARAPTIAFHARQDPDSGPVTHPLDTDGSSIGIFANWRVRRLTPVECERLQGFPDGYTGVPYRGKPAADGPRYKALGNSMAVNVMRWIGARISEVDRLEPTA